MSKDEEEFEEWTSKDDPEPTLPYSHGMHELWRARKRSRKIAYLAACEKRGEDEKLLCVAYDYLVQHWDMDSEPLCKIKKRILAILEGGKGGEK